MKIAFSVISLSLILLVASAPPRHTRAPTSPVAGACSSTPAMSDPAAGLHWNGWGPTVTNTRFQAADQARLSAADVPKLKLKWAFAFPNANRSRSQATIAGGRLFVANET